jgi:hypothetical protein
MNHTRRGEITPNSVIDVPASEWSDLDTRPNRPKSTLRETVGAVLSIGSLAIIPAQILFLQSLDQDADVSRRPAPLNVDNPAPENFCQVDPGSQTVETTIPDPNC